MKYLIYLLLFLVSFGQLQRISFLDQQVSLYLHELVMVIGLIVRIRQLELTKAIRQIGQIRLFRRIIFFLGILLLSLIANFWRFEWWQNLVGFLYWLRLVLYFSFFIILLDWQFKAGDKAKEIIKRALNIFVFLTLTFSYLQYFLYPNLRNLSYLGWDPHQYRVFGLFFDTTTAGIIFVILFFWLGSQKKIGFVEVVTQVGLLGLILLTYSRISYLSFVVGLGYFLKNKISFKKLTIFYFLFFIFIFLLPRPFGEGVKLERAFTIKSRINDYQTGFKLSLKAPILGYGYNRIRYVKNSDTSSHAGAAFSSSFLTILVASGLVGLIGMVRLMKGMFNQGNLLAKTVVLIVAVASLFDNVFLNNFILLLLLTIVFSDFKPAPEVSGAGHLGGVF